MRDVCHLYRSGVILKLSNFCHILNDSVIVVRRTRIYMFLITQKITSSIKRNCNLLELAIYKSFISVAPENFKNPKVL